MPARLPRRQALSARLRARREADRRHQPLRHRGAGRWPHHRAGRDPHQPSRRSGRPGAERGRPGKGGAVAGGEVAHRQPDTRVRQQNGRF